MKKQKINNKWKNNFQLSDFAIAKKKRQYLIARRLKIKMELICRKLNIKSPQQEVPE